MYFNKLLDSTDYEISSYVKKYLIENSNYSVKLHVGCDSQNIDWAEPPNRFVFALFRRGSNKSNI